MAWHLVEKDGFPQIGTSVIAAVTDKFNRHPELKDLTYIQYDWARYHEEFFDLGIASNRIVAWALFDKMSWEDLDGTV